MTSSDITKRNVRAFGGGKESAAFVSESIPLCTCVQKLFSAGLCGRVRVGGALQAGLGSDPVRSPCLLPVSLNWGERTCVRLAFPPSRR